jgi:hypothetical protein
MNNESQRTKLTVAAAQSISSHGIHDLGAIDDYLERIRAPDDLIYINRVASEMNQLIDYLSVISNEFSENTLALWKRINDWILEDPLRLHNMGIKVYQNNDMSRKSRPIVTGKNVSHPLYCVIWTGLKDEAYEQNYLCLKSVFFLIWPWLEEKTLIGSVINKDYLYAAAWSIRKLGEKGYTQQLMKLPERPIPPRDYWQHLHQLHEDNNLTGEACNIYRYICIALGKERFVSRSGRGSGNSNGGGPLRGVAPRDSTLLFVAEWEDETDPFYRGGRIYKQNVLQGPLRGNGNDLTINDFNAPMSVYEMFPRGEDFLFRDAKQEALILQGKKNAIAMRNQLLPNHRGMMGFYNLAKVAQYLDSALIDQHYQCHELAHHVLLAMVLVYGFNVADGSTMYVLKRRVASLDNECRMAYIKCDRQIMLEVQSMTTGKAAEQAIPVKKYLLLGVPERLANAIERLDSLFGHDKRSNYPLFEGKGEDYHKGINALVREATGTRSTHISLRNTIFGKTTNHCDDLADAMMLTGHSNGFATTRLHYTTRPAATLEASHRQMFNAVIKEVAYEFEWKPEAMQSWLVLEPRKAQEGYVGSRLTPSQEAVQKLVSKLHERMKEARQMFDWSTYHNLYTAYTVLMLDFATGSRAVDRKYSLATSINLPRGLVILSDKDAGDFYNTRIAPLPSHCLKQLAAYNKHRENVLMHLVQKQEPKTDALLASIHQCPTAWNDYSLRKYVQENISTFFFLDEKLHPVQKLPQQMRLHIKDIWHLALNVNRHYLRYQLRLHNVAGELVDALLGHWQHGEEPYGRFSTMSPREVIDTVEPVIEKIMIEDGWVETRGLHSDY